MPIYTMGCRHCDHTQEIFRTIAKIDDDLPTCCGQTMQRVICAPMVIGDIAPYQAVAIDAASGKAPMITSRSQHRDYLKRNGYVEVGNEMPKQRTETHGDFNVRRELTQAVREVLPKFTR